MCGNVEEGREMMEKMERTWDRKTPYNCSRSQCARVVSGKGSHDWAWGKVQTNFATINWSLEVSPSSSRPRGVPALPAVKHKNMANRLLFLFSLNLICDRV
jgi:hypothetical protein